MGLIKSNPQVPDTPRRRYSWESEFTLVQERNTLPKRILRFIQGTWLWALVIGFVLWALRDPSVMAALAVPFQLFLRLMFAASFILIQFVAMFYFLGRARMYTIWPGAEGVSFDDYRGQPELLDQAKQVVKMLRGVKAFEQAGGEPLNGLLLEGPPGTGKTWLAQAISTEAGVPFFYVDASGMGSMFVGIAPLKVMNLYRRARRAAKEYGASIIFIDEIDAVGSRAGVSTGRANDTVPSMTHQDRPEHEGIVMGGMGGMGGMGLLSTLLTEMSGFSQEHGFWARRRTWWYKNILRRNPPKPQKRVLTIGATNRVSALDPALLRPGRFDKKVRVDAPDLEGRRDIIEYYLTKMAHDETVDPLVLASETPFYTPADIKYLLNESLRYALFDDRTYMTMRDIRMAQPEHEMGIRQPIKMLAAEDKYRLAAHEAAHAIAIRLYKPNFRISRITIIRQGGAHGYVLSYPAREEDQFDYIGTYDQLTNHLRVAIAGKAGEIEYVGLNAQTLGVGIGFGDGSDFGTIRQVLWSMANAGMFGVMGASFNGTNYPPEMAQVMEETLREILEEVRLALRAHSEMGKALIQLLLEKDELLADEVEAFFNRYGFSTPKINLDPYQANGVVQ
jgi:cell division protease FtsH